MFDSRNELIHAGVYFAEKENAINDLYHYGRKGMKWGENIFFQEPEKQKARSKMDKDKFDRMYRGNTEESSNPLKRFLSGTGNKIKDTASDVYDTASNKVNAVGNAGKSVNKAYNLATSKFGEKAVNNAIARYGAKQAENAVKDTGNKIKDTATNVYNNAANKVNAVGNMASNKANAIGNAGKMVDNTYNYATSKFGEKAVNNAIARYGAKQAGEAISDTANTAGDKVKEGISDVGRSINRIGKTPVTKMGTKFRDNKMKEYENAKKKAMFETKIEDLKSGAEDLGEKIKEGASTAGEKIKSGAQDIGGKIKEGASNTGEKIKEGLGNAGNTIKSWFNKDEETNEDKKEKAKDKEASVKDISKSAQDDVRKQINSTGLLNDIPVIMLSGDQNAVLEQTEKLDKIINDVVDGYIQSAGLSYDDPNTYQEALDLKKEISDEYSDLILTQYYALMEEQQRLIRQQQQQAIQDTPNPATHPWMFGM